MHKITVDTTSRFHVVVPEVPQQDKLMVASDKFLTYDQTLPPEKQSPFAAHLAKLRQECVPHHEQFYSSETQRAIASDNVKRLEEEAGDHLKQAQLNLTALYWKTPSEAEAWGFEVKQTTGNIILPHTKRDVLRVLGRYIAKEESRPEEERFAAPDLARVIEVREQLVLNIDRSTANEMQRRASRIARDEAFTKLKETLRLAAGCLIVLHFDHKISPELHKWGFEVVERSSRSGEQESNEADKERASYEDSDEAVAEAVPSYGQDNVNGSVDLALESSVNGR